MGRRRRQYYTDRRYGTLDLRSDRGTPGTSVQSVIKFADSSPGPVAAQLVQQELVGYDARGELQVKPERISSAVEQIKSEIVSAREYPQKEFGRLASESTGLTPKRAINAEARTYRARVEAIYAAANATGTKISPADKRVLNPLREGRFTDLVYGKQGQYEGGTLASRLKATRGPRSTGARAAELREALREYRYGDTSSVRYA